LRKSLQTKDVPELKPYLSDVAREVNDVCSTGGQVIVEGSHGTFLSLALTRDYPYSTSDNCTTAALADDVGLNWRYIKEVILVVKALPSRVGGGPLPFQISEEEQDARNIAEFGVRTGRRRKKSSGISWDHLEEAVMLNGPTQIALTFCDHLDPDIRDKLKITPRVQGLIDKIEEVAQVPVTLVETGKRFDAIYDLS
jgi:adenylosuccinate synthase